MLRNQFLHGQVSSLVAFLEVPLTDAQCAFFCCALNIVDGQIILGVQFCKGVLSDAHTFGAKANFALLTYCNSMLIIKQILLVAAETLELPYSKSIFSSECGGMTFGTFLDFGSICWLTEISLTCWILISGRNVQVGISASYASVVPIRT